MLHHFYFKRQLLSLYILAFELKAVCTFYYLAVMLRFLLPFFLLLLVRFFPFFLIILIYLVFVLFFCQYWFSVIISVG